jgi:hypothetical protein
LEATVRGEPGANSGIFIHTDMTTRDKSLHLAKGYEIQLNSSQKEKRKTGSLYAVVDLDKSPVDESQWFKVRVTVRDKHITIYLNDRQVTEKHIFKHIDKANPRVEIAVAPVATQQEITE